MKNIADENTANEIIARIKNLKPGNNAKWGKMNAPEMVCHVSDQIKMAVGIIETEPLGNIFLMTFGKWAVLSGMPVPKGKIDTLKELKQGYGGTRPGDFENDKTELIRLVKEFKLIYPAGKKIRHAAFGPMNFKQWANLTYTHLDHHLKQFGV